MRAMERVAGRRDVPAEDVDIVSCVRHGGLEVGVSVGSSREGSVGVVWPEARTGVSWACWILGQAAPFSRSGGDQKIVGTYQQLR